MTTVLTHGNIVGVVAMCQGDTLVPGTSYVIVGYRALLRLTIGTPLNNRHNQNQTIETTDNRGDIVIFWGESQN